MKDKYNMSLKENVFLAKRNLVENIYSNARVEGLNTTFPETYAIVEKANLNNVDISTVSVILNLKHAWQFVLNNIQEPLDLDYICEVHNEVAKDEALSWGKLRTGKVAISGTNYVPPIPNEKAVKKVLDYYNNSENITERAIERMLWSMREQLFWDGNKRTSLIIANKDLISHGKGLITVSDKNLAEFMKLLSDFYTTDDNRLIKSFIYENCIEGIDFNLENKNFDEQDYDNSPSMKM